MPVSKRLEKIVHMIRPCRILADIGCDHGFVPVLALREGRAQRAIAADVAPGPLEAARKSAAAAGTLERTAFYLSDGFQELPDDCGMQCAVIAGMGGILMSRILKEGRLSRFPELRQLILSPQSDLALIRHCLIDELQFTILRELCILDEGKYYFLMDVYPGQDVPPEHLHKGMLRPETGYSEWQYLYGRETSPDAAGALLSFLEGRRTALERAYARLLDGGGDPHGTKAEGLAHELELTKQALRNLEV